MIRDELKGKLTQLYPKWEENVELTNLYLRENLRNEAERHHRPYFYANFITSLDGRIAVPTDKDLDLSVPGQLANDRDWRLFQELAIQSDIVISTGRYLRDYAAGSAQEILQVYDDPEFNDLKDWRTAHRLSPYPDLAIVSRSLEFEVPESLLKDSRKLVVITTEASSAERKKTLASQSITLLECGVEEALGEQVASGLKSLGYHLVYSAAGPRIAHMLLSAGVLDRLYLTFAFRLLGNTKYASILEGSGLMPARDLHLHSLFLDPQAPGPTGQLFSAFDCR